MGWEWRVFYRLAAGAGGEEATGGGSKVEEGGGTEVVDIESVVKRTGLKFPEFGTRGRTDPYLVYRKGCGVKFRGRKSLEIKMRTQKEAYADGYKGNMEKWKKKSYGESKDLLEAARRVLTKTDDKAGEHLSRCMSPAVVVDIFKCRRNARHSTGVVVEESRLAVQLQGGSVSQTWGTIAVEGKKRDIKKFLQSTDGAPLLGIVPHCIVGGYPTFVVEVARSLAHSSL